MKNIAIAGCVTIGLLLGFGHLQSAEDFHYTTYKEETEQIIITLPTEECTEELHMIHEVNLDDDIPEEVQRAAEFWGHEYQICPELLESIAYEESRYNSKAINKDGSCKGLMQIKESVHKARIKRLGVTDLMDVNQNMHVAADLLAELFERYEDDAIVLMRYNGDSRTNTISGYAKRILERSAELEEKHKKG